MRLIACEHRPRRPSHGRRTPNQDKNRRKMMGSPIFPGIEHIIECGKSRRVHAVVWNPDLRGIESPADDVESIPRDFSAAPEANRPRNALQRSGVASRAPCLLLNRQCVTKTTKPGNTRLNARYGISAVREECA